MKYILLLNLIIWSVSSFFSQNILEALQLKEDSIKKYTVGELSATDTIVDIVNGYYEEYHQDEQEKQRKMIIRQATIFNNSEGSKMLGTSINEWDFQCFKHTTNFYEITKNQIVEIPIQEVVPHLSVSQFFKDDQVIVVLKKYLPELQGNYLDSNATIADVLNEVYDIVYVMPQKGTKLVATLAVCDYIPTNEINISNEDWAVIENSFLSIELPYNKKKKVFKQPPFKKRNGCGLSK